MAKKRTEEQAELNRENGKLGGRPPKYKSAEELESAIDNYFASHNTRENIPKWPDMLNELRISDNTLLRYRTDKEYIENGYSDAIKKAEQMFSSTLMQLAVDYPQLQSLVIFLLKQPHNGGYRDKQETDNKTEMKIHISVGGLDDK